MSKDDTAGPQERGNVKKALAIAVIVGFLLVDFLFFLPRHLQGWRGRDVRAVPHRSAQHPRARRLRAVATARRQERGGGQGERREAARHYVRWPGRYAERILTPAATMMISRAIISPSMAFTPIDQRTTQRQKARVVVTVPSRCDGEGSAWRR